MLPGYSTRFSTQCRQEDVFSLHFTCCTFRKKIKILHPFSGKPLCVCVSWWLGIGRGESYCIRSARSLETPPDAPPPLQPPIEGGRLQNQQDIDFFFSRQRAKISRKKSRDVIYSIRDGGGGGGGKKALGPFLPLVV